MLEKNEPDQGADARISRKIVLCAPLCPMSQDAPVAYFSETPSSTFFLRTALHIAQLDMCDGCSRREEYRVNDI